MSNLSKVLSFPARLGWKYGLMCIGLLSNLSISLGQTTYYVASSGNDNNSGRSTDAPFQTLTKVNSLALQPGDQVLFRRGDTFRGSLLVTRSGSAGSPIVIDAYGSGDKPILTGSTPVTNWANIGNNVWQATCSACGDRITGLYRDNSALPLGRYPNLDASNKGYLTVQSHSGRSQLTSVQGLPTNFTGGEAVFRPVNWILNRSTITGQSGNTLYLNGSGSYDVSDQWGYFIQNHPATLDQVGEWYYNPGNKTIQLYDNQSNPNNQTVTATVNAQAVYVNTASYITIRNLQITQSLATNLLTNNTSNLTLSNNDITQSGEDAVLIQGGGSQVLMEGNLVENANNNGVNIASYQNVTLRGNTIRKIGLIPGRGKSGDGMYVGMQFYTTANTLIENNVVDNIGYVAINFSTSTTVRYNQISNYCITKSDGSGLYIWNGNQQGMNDIHLLSNIVYNGIGAPEGTPSGYTSEANGIYLDDCTINIEVAGNTVYNCTGYGIYLHGSSSIRLTGNTVYNNGEAQLVIRSSNGCQPRNNVIQNNLLVSRLASQPNAIYESGQNDLASFGQFDNNVYARPFNDAVKIHIYNGTSGSDLSLAQWQSQYGRDLTSSNSPITYNSGSPDDYIKFIVNPTASNTQTALNGAYRDLRNTAYSGQVTVPAFSSVVLLKDVATPVTLRTPENPANTVNGLNYGYYEGAWSLLPDFGSLTANKTGTANSPNLASDASRNYNYALNYTGYISVPADGTYTFYTSSDDGSKLYIGSTLVVNNDGLQAEQEKSGSIGLKAGVHAITIQYMQGGGGQVLTVSYSGPNLGKQAIPASAYYRINTTTTPPTNPTNPTVTLRTPENPANTVNGLDYSYYEGTWGMLPDFSTLSAIKTATTSSPNPASERNRTEYFAIKYTGYVSVPTDGTYTFYTSSDDGSKLFIGTTQVVTNDGTHSDQELSGTIGLKAGVHALTIQYMQGNGGQALTVSYSGPNLNKQVIPASAYYRVNTGTNPVTNPPASTGTGIYLSDLNWASTTNGYGPVEKDRSNGEAGAGDGRTITLNGVTYAKGLGVHAPSEVIYNLSGSYTRFITDVGIDDEMSGCGTVVFNVYVDNVLVYSSGVMTSTSPTQSINIDVSGKQTLRLVVTDAGDGYGCDHADWAGARLTPVTTTVSTSSGAYLSDLNWTASSNGYGPVERDRSNGEAGAADGKTITLNGVTYAKGLGVHAPSEVTYNLGGTYTRFITDVGIDDEMSACGSAVFNVYVDNVLVYTSGVMTPTSPTQSINIDVSGKQTLKLVVTDGGDGMSCDHADWAGARLTGSAGGRVAALTNELKPEDLLQVYPIPAQDEMQIRYNTAFDGNANVQLVNILGQSVKQETHSVTSGENFIKLLVGELNRGSYVLKITQGEQQLTRKVILIK